MFVARLFKIDESFGGANTAENKYSAASVHPKRQSILNIAEGQKDVQVDPATLVPFNTSGSHPKKGNELF